MPMHDKPLWQAHSRMYWLDDWFDFVFALSVLLLRLLLLRLLLRSPRSPSRGRWRRWRLVAVFAGMDAGFMVGLSMTN